MSERRLRAAARRRFEKATRKRTAPRHRANFNTLLIHCYSAAKEANVASSSSHQRRFASVSAKLAVKLFRASA